MPELPEVFTIATDLKKNIEGAVIKKVILYGGYNIGSEVKLDPKSIEGAGITKVGRIAKNTLIKLSNNYFLHYHLAMTGRILLSDVKEEPTPHTRVDILIEKTENALLLRFNDVRMFGKVQILSAKRVQELKQKYGPEPIAKNLDPEYFHKSITSKKTNIKNVLLDQSKVAGLGNIYATDALWLSGIDPRASAHLLTKAQTKKLLEATKNILLEGIAHRGSTLPDEAYVDIFGKPGFHQNYFRIYGKKACPKCKGKVIYFKLNGRGTYTCETCQKI